jgi:predicted SAM-dependent methyltransferase
VTDARRIRQRLKRLPGVRRLNAARRRVVRRVTRALRAPGDSRTTRSYIRTHEVRKLQVGSGPNLFAGWLNTDLMPDAHPSPQIRVIFLDATRPFPFKDETFHYIFSEHLIEHLSLREGTEMIRECLRVLEPGGRLRLATPDLAAIVGLYSGPLNRAQRHYVEWVMTRWLPDVKSGNPCCYVINQMFNSWEHRFIYDAETLTAMLVDAGFVDIIRHAPGASDDPVLRGVESHGRALNDEDVNLFETLVLECIKPVANGMASGDRAAAVKARETQ